MELIHDWFGDRKVRRRLREFLQENDPYDLALAGSEFQPLAALSFCSLYVSGCVDQKEEATADAPRYSYRLRAEVDLQLLGPVDRIVAERMPTFRHAYQVIPEAAEELRRSVDTLTVRPLFDPGESGPAARKAISELFDRLMSAALEINAPVGCGV
jgi:hypothetical protein